MSRIDPNDLFIQLAYALKIKYANDTDKLIISFEILEELNDLIYKMEYAHDEEKF
jgi:hypothetical protein